MTTLTKVIRFCVDSLMAVVVLGILTGLLYLTISSFTENSERPTEGVVREAYFDQQFGRWHLVIVSDDEKRTRIINLEGDYATFKQYPVGTYYKKVENE